MRRSLALAVIGMTVLAGCSSPSPSPTGSPTPATRDTMVVALPELPAGIDPDTGTATGEALTIGAQLYGDVALRWGHTAYASQQSVADPSRVPGFWVADPNPAKLQPGAVESCHLADDGSTVTLKLQQGVKSSYGNELTTADLAWSLQRSAAHRANGALYMGLAGAPDPAQWKAVDRYTMQVSRAGGRSLADLCPLLASPVAAGSWFMDSTETRKHATANDPWAGAWVSQHGAWFGPYAVSDWQSGTQVVLEANPNYALGQLSVRKIVFQVVPEASDRLAKLTAGTVDLAEGITPAQAASLDGQPGVRPLAIRAGRQLFALMNVSKPPFNKLLVRQALNSAIDRAAIATSVYGGLAVPSAEWLAPGLPGYQALNSYPYDLAHAQSLLLQSGWANGFNATLSYSSASPEQEQVALAWQASLKQIGINLTVKKLDPDALAKQVVGGRAADFTFALWEDAPPIPDAVAALQLWYGSSANARWYHFADRALDSRLGACANETDASRRTSCAQEAARSVAGSAPTVPIVAPDVLYAVTEKVRNANLVFGGTYLVDAMVVLR